MPPLMTLSQKGCPYLVHLVLSKLTLGWRPLNMYQKSQYSHIKKCLLNESVV